MRTIVAAGLCLALCTTAALSQGKRSQGSPSAEPAEPVAVDAALCDAVPAAGLSEVCRCADAPATGSVWGSGPYTGDSSICTAARHAGVIGADGGVFELLGLPGQDGYEGSEANGVTTSNWGSYGESFDVQPVGATTVQAPVQTDAPACDAAPAEGEVLVCACAEAPTNGSVWGSNPYTADSDICTAARHAGQIGAAGGVLQMTGLPGQDSYEASSANGVTTSSWGAYGQSFLVGTVSASVDMPAQGGPVCDVIPGEVDRYSCTCTGDAGGSVWGSGPYTADSNICTAARHASVIGTDGGTVTVIRLPGLESYTGSEANGEVTSGWGSYDASIVFDRN